MKQTRCNRIFWAALAFAVPATVLADNTATLNTGQSISFDTCTVGANGDATFTGAALTFASGVKAYNWGSSGGLSFYLTLNGGELAAVNAAGTNTPILLSALVVNDVISLITRGGNVVDAVVTASSGSSLSIRYGTFVAGQATPVSGGGCGSGGPTPPTITGVLNNSSNIPAGFPNSGISQGALFKVLGSSLADDGDNSLHETNPQQGGSPLPTTLHNASITVTVNGKNFQPGLYYATSIQIDGVMPSNVPTGSGTLTVTYKGTPSIAFAIVVVAAAPGLTTYGSNTVVAQDFNRPTDPYGGLVTLTKSAPPGGIMTIWGSGFGATSDDDISYTGSPHAVTVSYTIYIGGVQVTNLGYAGRTVYPGVHVFVLTIPQNVPTGCYVPIVAVSVVNGVSTVSNTATLPIHAGGGICTDPQFGLSGDTLSSLTTYRTGFLFVGQTTAPGSGTTGGAFGIFEQTSGVSGPGGGGFVSIGGCLVTQTVSGAATGTTTPLNPGTITLSGPGGSLTTLTSVPILPGFYSAMLASIPSTGGAYVFNSTAGSGANAVGAFTATVNFPNPLLAWSNQAAAASVNRSQGLAVTWSGGSPGSYVVISGSSASGSVNGSFSCYVPQSLLQFTVPSYILSALPAGSGTTTVQNSTNLSTFSASGLDFGAAFGSVSFSVNSNYI